MPETIVASENDSIPSLAFETGLTPDTIWNDPHNAALNGLRKNQYHLKPGDQVYIRDRERREESRAVDSSYIFKRKCVPAKLRIQVKLLGEPWRNEPYTLILGQLIKNGRTGADGMVEAYVQPNEKCGQLVLQGGKLTIHLNIGKLNPEDTVSGMKQRLRNLGFAITNESDEVDDEFRTGLKRFQTRYQLEKTGEPDAATKAKIKEVHP